MQNSNMKATVLLHGFPSSFFFFVLVISVLLPGCQAVGCQYEAVGIADPKKIPDNRFTASSHYDNSYAPKNARLNGAAIGWTPKTKNNPNDYLQIDLGQVFVLCAVATQGSSRNSEWVTEYKISTSVDNNVWTAYPSDASPKLFAGNTDRNTVVKNILNPSVQAKLIRFIPTRYKSWKTLRVEAYGSPADLLSNLKSNVTCGNTYMQINLKNLYLSDIDWRLLHLKDKSCKARRTDHTTSLRAPLTGCGTTYRENNNTLVFWNEVRNEPHWQNRSLNISREKHLVIPFYCKYERSRLVSTSFSPSKKIVTASEGSYGNFTFTMDLYQSSNYSTPYSPFAYPVPVYPRQLMWVQYEVKNTNADLVVFAENCRATPSNDPNATPQYVFLQRGCVRDPTMVYWYNPYSNVQRFSIRSFRFVYSNSFYVYLHCELLVCHRNTNNSRCAQGCISGSRGRRETADMDGSKVYDLSAGPLKGGKINAKSSNQEGSLTSKQLIGGLGAVGGVFFVITILLSVIVYRNRRRGQDNKPTSIALDVTVNSYEQDNVDSDEKNDSKL